MKKLALAMMISGGILLAGYILHDPMDEETALFRYGKADGTLASTEELEAARNGWGPGSPSPWLGIGGIFLLGSGYVLRRPVSRL